MRNNKELKNTISIALSHHVCLSIINNKYKDKIPESIIKFFEKKINPNAYPDRTLLNLEHMYDFVDWNMMDRKKVVRILARDASLFNRFDFDKYKFSITELFPLFIQNPDLITDFVNDYDNLSSTEAIKLLQCNPDLIDKISLEKFKFRKKDMLEIIRIFSKAEKIIDKLDLSVLDHFSTRKLLISSGDRHIDRIDKKSLKALDWLDVLKHRPELLGHCNLNLFKSNDYYLLTKLVLQLPELDYLIDENSSKITGLGWENLILGDLDRYQDVCDWSKLSESNWKAVTKKHPSLNSIKRNYFLF